MQILVKDHFLFTSESVATGHPDKLCDYISDCILDAYLELDPDAKVACETCVKNNICMVFGEVNSFATINYEFIIRQAIKNVGYDNISKGMDYSSCSILINMDHQSADILNALHDDLSDEDLNAGDQGLMIGYASDESPQYMPMTLVYASSICQRLEICRKDKIIDWLGSDGKCQVTLEYMNDNGHLTIVKIHTILISVQHKEGISIEQINQDLMEHVINKVIPEKYLDNQTIFYFNPSGRFVLGGPMADAGVTGRKIIVDSYGGWGGHGGGSFSGKDPSKVDRSGAYAARWVAKSLVENNYCKRVVIEIAYGIGMNYPISLYVNSYGTVREGYSDYDLQELVQQNFDLRPGCIIRDLDLKRPIYKKTSRFGHFGQSDPDFKWEISKKF